MPNSEKPAIVMTKPVENPFLDFDGNAYGRWREKKLARHPRQPSEATVDIDNPADLSDAERSRLVDACQRCNFVIYRTDNHKHQDKMQIRQLASQLGLNRLDPNLLADDDGVTSLTVVEHKSQRGYIPYTNRRLLWHTDGYYNDEGHRIRAMMLHCVRPAAEGGENALFDPEMAYLLLRDESVELVKALMDEQAMTIPANEEAEGVHRPAQSGPVFSVDGQDGSLHMRYTARTRSIQWKDQPETREAVNRLDELLNGDNEYIFRYRLNAGEGILCNNILHNRTAFSDTSAPQQHRLVYRARYYERISGTGLEDMAEN